MQEISAKQVKEAARPRALFIGRWQPFHYGHYWLIQQKLGAKVPVLVAVRDIPPDEKNPFTTSQTILMINKVFAGQDVQVIRIPDIESVNYGRGVGYSIIEHQPSEDVKIISATQIRQAIAVGDSKWKDMVPPQIHADVLNYIKQSMGTVQEPLPKVLWLYGLSGSGKSTIAHGLREQLQRDSVPVITLDGDEVRSGLNADLGFSHEDRKENIRRLAHTAKLLSTKGYNVIVSAITPKAEYRSMAREIIGPSFHDVHIDCPVEICEQRDPKGLYKKARSGAIPSFTGVTDSFEISHAALRIPTHDCTPAESVSDILSFFHGKDRKDAVYLQNTGTVLRSIGAQQDLTAPISELMPKKL